jgi:PAS domain S-box-containing protein
MISAENEVSISSMAGALPGASILSHDAELILNAIPGGVYGVDCGGRATFVNDAAARILGWNAADLLGQRLHDVIHHSRPDGSPYPIDDCPVFRTLTDGQVRRSESDVFYRKDGVSVPVEFDSHPIRRDGLLVGALVAFRDVSERRRNEERRLQLVEEQFARAKAEFKHARLREVLAQVPALVCITRGPAHVVDTVSEHYRLAIGLHDERGKAFADAFPETPAEWIAILDEAYASGDPHTGQEVPGHMLGAADPEQRFYNYVVQPLCEDSRLVYGLMIHAVDVTEQVRARRDLEQRTAELKQTSERLRLAAEAGKLGAWEWHVETGQLIWSPEVERIHGYEPGTFPGTLDAFEKIIHPDERERILSTIADTLKHSRSHVLDYRILHPHGTVRWVEARGRMFFDATGKPERLVGICMDVTEAKLSEQALLTRNRLSELMARIGLILTRGDPLHETLHSCVAAVVEQAEARFAGIWTLDATSRVLELEAGSRIGVCHDGAHERVAIGCSEIGRVAAEQTPYLTNDVASDPHVPDHEWARRNGIVSFAGYPLMVGSELLGVLAVFASHPLSDPDRQALGAVAHGIAMDIQRRRSEEALRVSERDLRRRADELGRVAAALEQTNRELDAFAYAASHDLRAPLRGIANLAQWIKEDLEGQMREDTREMLDLLQTRMFRMESLIAGLLEYSRAGRGRHAPEQVDTSRLVQDVIDLLSPPPNMSITVARKLPKVEAERLPLQQIFLNLIGNAIKHVRRVDAQVSVSARDAGEFYEFTVQDNGDGIPAEFQDRIWGIFQTLEVRDKVEGTGIGLALVKKLAEAHGGRAWVESGPGTGAAFRFLWPKQPARTVAAESEGYDREDAEYSSRRGR